MLRFNTAKILRKSLDLLQRDWLVFAFRKAVVLCLIALALFGGWCAILFYVNYDSDHAEAQLEAPAPIPDALTDGSILAALDKLPAQFREALLLVDVEEFSYKEASEILQVPIGTIMSRLNRARGLLRSQLTEVARSYGLSAAEA